MIFLALTLVTATSLLISSALRLRGKIAYMLSLYLLSTANIILVGYILGIDIIRQLNNHFFFLGGHTGILLIASFFWHRAGKPSLWGPFTGIHNTFSWQSIKNTVTGHPDLTTFSLGMLVLYIYSFILGVTVPPNNYDSLSTHLSRVGYWLQFGSYLPWATPSLHQVSYPLNAPLQTLWTIVFTGSDSLVASVQWLAALICGLSVLGISRQLGYSMRSSLFVMLITLSFPLLVLQSSTPQNDIVTAAFYSTSVFYILYGKSTKSFNSLYLAGLSIAIGLGTKHTFIILMPGLFFFTILVLLQNKRLFFKRFIRLGTASLIFSLFFGLSYNFINLSSFGNPFGPSDYTVRNLGATDSQSITGKIAYNLPRLMYQSLDTGGLPNPIDGYAHKAKAWLVRTTLKTAEFNIEDDTYVTAGHSFNLEAKTINEESNAWYGPISVLLLYPALVYALLQGLQRENFIAIGLLGSFFLFWPLEISVRPGWDPYQGRYFSPIFVTLAPLIAIWFKQKRHNIFSWGIVVCALVIAGYSLFYNPAKPILGKWADDIGVWNKDRIFLMTVQHKIDRELHYMVIHSVPKDATLGFVKFGDFTEYPLFGENFTRRVIPVYPLENLTNETWLNEHEIEYLLVMNGSESTPPLAYVKIDQVDRWILYHRQK
jgi:4-amino-4-deoxy-L-arabinose transferase-like glycosyltransferase